jgi:hypothetical protein
MDPNIEQLTDERDVLEAQRDHYLEYCEELKTQVSERDKLLLGKLLTSLRGRFIVVRGREFRKIDEMEGMCGVVH